MRSRDARASRTEKFFRSQLMVELEQVSVMLSGMADASLTTDLGKVMVTGGSGFVGCNLVAELLERGHWVRSFDRVPSPMADHPRLETVVGDICDTEAVAAAVNGVDTIFHTAALIELMGGKSVTEEYRKRSFGVNVEGTKNLVHAAQKAGVKRFVYTASNSVVIGGKAISGGDETLPYTDRFADLYTETKVAAEKFVLSQNDVDGLLTCSIRPSGIWGRGDQTMFRKVFERVVTGQVKVLIGSKNARLDNSYVHNLVHGFILAGQHLVEGGTATRPGVLHQRRRPGEHVRVRSARRRGVRSGLAAVPDFRPAGSRDHEPLAAAAFPVQPADATAGTACGGTALPRQLLLGGEGPPRPRL